MQVREYSYEDIDEMQQCAAMIRQQITNSTLMAVGARNWKFSEHKGVVFQVNAGSKRQYIEVILKGDDTYTVISYKLKRVTNERIVLESGSGIYCSELGETVYGMVNK